MTDEMVKELTIEETVDNAVKGALDKYGFDEIVKRFTPGVDEGEQKESDSKPFKNFGDQMMAVYNASVPGRGVDPRLLQVKDVSGLSEGVPSDGGFLVQQDFSSELLRLTHETGVLYPRCRSLPISANSNGIKIPGIDESSRETGSRLGGIRGYWAAEAALKTKSKPKFWLAELSLNKMIGLCYATDEMLQDSTVLGNILMTGFAEEFNFLFDDAIIRGTGAGQPLGILNAACTVSVAIEPGQDAETIVSANLDKMWSRMHSRSKANSVWLINADVQPELDNLFRAVGTGGLPAYMPPGGLSGQPYGTIKGRPVLEIEQCSTLGTVGDILLVDLSQYLVIEKGGIQSATSIHVRFIYDETTFRFVWRVDGQPAWKTALTPYQGDNTTSPFISLAARE